MSGMYDDMTLGEATEFRRGPGWACACSGRPPGSSYCYCQLIILQAARLHRAAHIVVKLVDATRSRTAE